MNYTLTLGIGVEEERRMSSTRDRINDNIIRMNTIFCHIPLGKKKMWDTIIQYISLPPTVGLFQRISSYSVLYQSYLHITMHFTFLGPYLTNRLILGKHRVSHPRRESVGKWRVSVFTKAIQVAGGKFCSDLNELVLKGYWSHSLEPGIKEK